MRFGGETPRAHQPLSRVEKNPIRLCQILFAVLQPEQKQQKNPWNEAVIPNKSRQLSRLALFLKITKGKARRVGWHQESKREN